MQALDNLFGSQLKNLEQALGRTTQRHGLLTGNLANLNTPGYKRKDLDFTIVLDEVQSHSKLQSASGNRDAQTDRSSLRVDGNNVDLEREAFALAETELRYQTLTEMTNRYFSGLRNAITEGK